MDTVTRDTSKESQGPTTFDEVQKWADSVANPKETNYIPYVIAFVFIVAVGVVIAWAYIQDTKVEPASSVVAGQVTTGAGSTDAQKTEPAEAAQEQYEQVEIIEDIFEDILEELHDPGKTYGTVVAH